jgi:TolB-like protein/Flp pilus assembly protein TadD
MAVAIVLLASGYFVRHGTPAQVAAAIPAKSIAVLPFANLSNDKANGYFVDGMQDLILTKLADIGDLKVIARTSTQGYGSHPQNLAQVGQQLGVATLLEGSVQKAGNEVLVNVQLIDAKTDAHIWAQSYQRTLDNVFGVEGEVATKVATALNAKLSPQAAAQLATNLSGNHDANDLYLRAEYFADRGHINSDTAQWKQALPLYRQAVGLAPDFALARARLSYVESELAWFGGGGEDVAQLNADARTQAGQALKLAPGLPEAQLALGYCDYYGKGDYAAALRAFSAVLKLRPNDTDALAAQGYVQRRQGNFDASVDSFKQSLALDPRNTSLAFELGSTYMMTSRYTEAEAAFHHALALDPANVRAKYLLSQTLLLANGDVPAALAAAAGDDSQLRQQQVALLTLQRKYHAALTLLDGIPDTPDNFNYTTSPKALQQANLYWLLGDAARARTLYERALPEARAQMAAAGGVKINEALVWGNIADAEVGVGQTREALAAIAKSQALVDATHDQSYGPQEMEWNAGLYASADRGNLAVPLLARALGSPGIGFNYSPVLLWLDPAWDPIRKTAAFQALLKKYAKDKPAVIYPAAPTS